MINLTQQKTRLVHLVASVIDLLNIITQYFILNLCLFKFRLFFKYHSSGRIST